MRFDAHSGESRNTQMDCTCGVLVLGLLDV
jgi:hypothetical protein